METKNENTSIPDCRLDPGNVIRCLLCNYETTDVQIDDCPDCKLPLAVLYTGDQHGDGCRECQIKKDIFAGKVEVFSVEDERAGLWAFNVTQAREAMKVLQPPVTTLPKEFACRLLYVNVTEPRHYSHIPADKRDEPGILCELEIGNGYVTYLLIDGSHRLGNKLVHGEPLQVYFLKDEMSRMFLFASMPGTILGEPPAEPRPRDYIPF